MIQFFLLLKTNANYDKAALCYFSSSTTSQINPTSEQFKTEQISSFKHLHSCTEGRTADLFFSTPQMQSDTLQPQLHLHSYSTLLRNILKTSNSAQSPMQGLNNLYSDTCNISTQRFWRCLDRSPRHNTSSEMLCLCSTHPRCNYSKQIFLTYLLLTITKR